VSTYLTRIAAAFLVLASLGACMTSPASRQALTSTPGERGLAEEHAKFIEFTLGLVRDPKITAYVEEVGQRLAAHATRKDIDYEFFVVDLASANALSLPDGHIYVSRGLLALINSEEELAGALGHEIGHVEAHHPVSRRPAEAAVPSAPTAASAAGVAASVLSRAVGTGLTDTGLATRRALLAPYSREQEREADRLGQDLAARAGWDPHGLSALLETLDREERQAGPMAWSDQFLAMHPSMPERIAATSAHAANLSWTPGKPIAKDRADLLSRFDGLIVGDDPAKGALVGNVFVQPSLGLRMALPPGWEAGYGMGFAGAYSPDRQAVLILRPAGVSKDPMVVAREQEERAGVALLYNARSAQINGLAAVREELPVSGKQGTYWLTLNWVAVGNLIWSIEGAAPAATAERDAQIINASIDTIGPISDADRERIEIVRLRVTPAADGEMLGSLRRRTGSTWNADQIAIANGLARDAVLAAGQLIKVPVREAFFAP
jgi:predicted Zn-dependent protease